MSQGPRTSNPDVLKLLTALRLEIQLDVAGSADLHVVLGDVCSWYFDADRASKARVAAVPCTDATDSKTYFASPAFLAAKKSFAQWLGRPLPALEGEALVEYVADALMIAADHSKDPGGEPQLLHFETPTGVLYLLRSTNDRREFKNEGFIPPTLNSPDTDAALGGIFREEGCTPAFAAHAAGCDRCLIALEDADFEQGLPDDFAKLRKWPSPARRIVPDLPPLPPVSGVAIIIPRSGPKRD
jgi:hypothetical protein